MKIKREEVLGIVGVLVHTMDFDKCECLDEVLFIERFLNKMGLPKSEHQALIDEARSHLDINDHVRRIETRQARIYAMQQTLLLVLSDGDYGESERASMKSLAERFSIDEVLFADLERWSLEGTEWQIRGAALLAR